MNSGVCDELGNEIMQIATDLKTDIEEGYEEDNALYYAAKLFKIASYEFEQIVSPKINTHRIIRANQAL